LTLETVTIPFCVVEFVESTDERYHAKCDAEDVFQVPGARSAELVGSHYQGQLLGCQHILPADDYLCLCLSAAHTLGEKPFRNFFDLSILTYGTSLKAYRFMSSSLLHVFLRSIDRLVWRVLILRSGRVDCAGARSLGQPTDNGDADAAYTDGRSSLASLASFSIVSVCSSRRTPM